MKPVISRLVSIYGIHWDIYHMLIVKLRNSMPRNTLFGQKMGVKIPNCTCNVLKNTQNTHETLYQHACFNLWSTLEYLSHAVRKAIWNFYCQRSTPFRPKMCVKMPKCTGNVWKTPKTHKKPFINRLVSIYGIRRNIYPMLLVNIWNYIATK